MLDLRPPPSAPLAPVSVRGLTEANAVDIWIARWLGTRRKDILARYGCDPRRLYDIWEGRAFPASRGKALQTFEARHPGLTARTDTSPHRRIPKPAPPPDAPGLFDALPGWRRP